MATRNDRPDSDSTRPATGPPAAAGADPVITDAAVPPPQIDARPGKQARTNVGNVRPIVLKYKRRGRRRKRYSRGTKDGQRLFYGISRGVYRLVNGAAAGAGTFWRRSNRSARRKRDGLGKDFLRNFARGFRNATREAGRGPYEVAREISRRRSWRNVRRFWRNAPLPFGYR